MVEIEHKNVFYEHCSFTIMLIMLIFKTKFRRVTSQVMLRLLLDEQLTFSGSLRLILVRLSTLWYTTPRGTSCELCIFVFILN